MNINRHEISSALGPPASAMGWGQQRDKKRRGRNRAKLLPGKCDWCLGDSFVGTGTKRSRIGEQSVVREWAL